MKIDRSSTERTQVSELPEEGSRTLALKMLQRTIARPPESLHVP